MVAPSSSPSSTSTKPSYPVIPSAPLPWNRHPQTSFSPTKAHPVPPPQQKRFSQQSFTPLSELSLADYHARQTQTAASLAQANRSAPYPHGSTTGHRPPPDGLLSPKPQLKKFEITDEQVDEDGGGGGVADAWAQEVDARLKEERSRSRSNGGVANGGGAGGSTSSSLSRRSSGKRRKGSPGSARRRSMQKPPGLDKETNQSSASDSDSSSGSGYATITPSSKVRRPSSGPASASGSRSASRRRRTSSHPHSPVATGSGGMSPRIGNRGTISPHQQPVPLLHPHPHPQHANQLQQPMIMVAPRPQPIMVPSPTHPQQPYQQLPLSNSPHHQQTSSMGHYISASSPPNQFQHMTLQQQGMLVNGAGSPSSQPRRAQFIPGSPKNGVSPSTSPPNAQGMGMAGVGAVKAAAAAAAASGGSPQFGTAAHHRRSRSDEYLPSLSMSPFSQAYIQQQHQQQLQQAVQQGVVSPTITAPPPPPYTPSPTNQRSPLPSTSPKTGSTSPRSIVLPSRSSPTSPRIVRHSSDGLITPKSPRAAMQMQMALQMQGQGEAGPPADFRRRKTGPASPIMTTTNGFVHAGFPSPDAGIGGGELRPVTSFSGRPSYSAKRRSGPPDLPLGHSSPPESLSPSSASGASQGPGQGTTGPGWWASSPPLHRGVSASSGDDNSSSILSGSEEPFSEGESLGGSVLGLSFGLADSGGSVGPSVGMRMRQQYARRGSVSTDTERRPSLAQSGFKTRSAYSPSFRHSSPQTGSQPQALLYLRLLAIVPAMIGSISLLLTAVAPTRTAGGSYVIHPLDALACLPWAYVTASFCFELTTGLTHRWLLYYSYWPSCVRLLSLQTICWPSTAITLRYLGKFDILMAWIVVGTTTACSRSIQIWVTSNVPHIGKGALPELGPGGHVAAAIDSPVAPPLRKRSDEGSRNRNTSWKAHKEDAQVWMRQRFWDWEAVGRLVGLRLGLLYLVTTWYLLWMRHEGGV